MKKTRLAAGILLALCLGTPVTAAAAPLDYQGVVNALKQDKQEIKTHPVQEGKKVLTEYVEYENTLYVSVGQTVLRELPDDKAKGIRKATLGKEFSQAGICENGWSAVYYLDPEEGKSIGYIRSEELSDQVQIQPVSQRVKAAEDVDILDFPGVKDGKVLGEYIEGDAVKRIGICNDVWSQVSFRNEKGKVMKGFVPTKALEGVEDEAETASAEAEAGALSPGSGEGIFVEATTGVTATAEGAATAANGVLVGSVVNAPEGAKLRPLGNFKITHYCPCSICCGPWADGITSTGVTAVTNRTIAVDPTQIPYGSKVVINGQVYVAEDCGGAIVTNCIDIYVASHEEGEAKGVYYTDVYLLEE